MRIVGGIAGGRILKVPRGYDVRPTPDLVKQALFNSLGDRVMGILSVQDMENEWTFDENDLNLLQAVANQTGVALVNARQYQLTDVQLSERVEELTALSAISQELN